MAISTLKIWKSDDLWRNSKSTSAPFPRKIGIGGNAGIQSMKYRTNKIRMDITPLRGTTQSIKCPSRAWSLSSTTLTAVRTSPSLSTSRHHLHNKPRTLIQETPRESRTRLGSRRSSARMQLDEWETEWHWIGMISNGSLFENMSVHWIWDRVIILNELKYISMCCPLHIVFRTHVRATEGRSHMFCCQLNSTEFLNTTCNAVSRSTNSIQMAAGGCHLYAETNLK